MRKSIQAAALFCALTAAAPAMFMNNTVQVPVDRVVANVEKWTTDKPTDPQGFYVLGRIHAMAYAYGPDLSLWGPTPGGARGGGGRSGRGRAPATEPASTATAAAPDPFNGQLPGFAPYDTIQVQRRENAKTVTEADAKHLDAALTNYEKAVALDNKSPLYELGLAWLFQETGKNATQLPNGFHGTAPAKPYSPSDTADYAHLILSLGSPDAPTRELANKRLAADMPKAYWALRESKLQDPEINGRIFSLLKDYWDLQALDHYRKAYSLSLDKDLAAGGVGVAADAQISAEAGDAMLEIFKSQPAAAQGDEIKTVAANVKKLHDKPRPITPIIFAMPDATRPGQVPALGDLVDSSARVHFDLAGDGIPRTWPWLKPNTALLVWDPALTGNITNARQLFGSRTWWIFYRNGYEALSVLDDNRDGQLTGAEMQGIAVWIDKNADAISQPGEVLSLQQAGITAIATTPNAPNGALAHSAGITFSNHTTTPTFDWITLPVSSDSLENVHK